MCMGNEFSNTVSNKRPIEFPTKTLAVPVNTDLLATVTHHTKDYLFRLRTVCKFVQRWKYYRMLEGKTQPAHLLTIISVCVIARLVHLKPDESAYPSLLKIIYLGSFATHLGAQLWMTFVSGLSLYFALPRHVFGLVQKVLFPKYFLLNACLSFLILTTFVKLQSSDNKFQLTVLVSCFLVELLIRLYLSPVLVKLMMAKNEIERQAGVGLEIGDYRPGNLTNCPKYSMLHSRFRKVHMTIAIGNMFSMACTFTHLMYLASKLCI